MRRAPILAMAIVSACAGPPPEPPPPRAPVVDVPCGGVVAPPSEITVELPAPAPPPEAEPQPEPEGDYPRAAPEAPCTNRETIFSGAFALGSGNTYSGSVPSRVVVRGDATLRISYPLRDDIAVPLHGPLRGEELLARIRAAYGHIYEEEDRVPGRHPYGIWGHDITDLFIEDVERCETATGVEIRVGTGS